MKQLNEMHKTNRAIKRARITLLRHFPTNYNHQKKLQGRRDIPIDMELAQERLETIILSQEWENATWFSSPLLRARQTALLLLQKHHDQHPSPDMIQTRDFLVEMDFGDYEGQTIKELRSHQGDDFTKNEKRGLHFMPPNGESPFMVIKRLKKGLLKLLKPQDDIATSAHAQPYNTHYICITHKGVMRAMLSLATGWDMQNDYPQKLDYSTAWDFDVSLEGDELRVDYCG